MPKKLTKAATAKISALFNEYREAHAIAAEAVARKDALNKQIKELASQYDLPLGRGAKTVYLNVGDGKALALTTAEKTITIDGEKLIDRVPLEVFRKLCKITKIDFSLTAYDELVRLEWVTEADILSCIADITESKDPLAGLRLSIIDEVKP